MILKLLLGKFRFQLPIGMIKEKQLFRHLQGRDFSDLISSI